MTVYVQLIFLALIVDCYFLLDQVQQFMMFCCSDSIVLPRLVLSLEHLHYSVLFCFCGLACLCECESYVWDFPYFRTFDATLVSRPDSIGAFIYISHTPSEWSLSSMPSHENGLKISLLAFLVSDWVPVGKLRLSATDSVAPVVRMLFPILDVF